MQRISYQQCVNLNCTQVIYATLNIESAQLFPSLTMPLKASECAYTFIEHLYSNMYEAKDQDCGANTCPRPIHIPPSRTLEEVHLKILYQPPQNLSALLSRPAFEP